MKRSFFSKKLLLLAVLCISAQLDIKTPASAGEGSKPTSSSKPKPGLWTGEPDLSFEVTADGKILNLVYTIRPSYSLPMGPTPACRVFLGDIPINNNTVDYKEGEKSDTKEPAKYLTGAFLSNQTFKGLCKAWLCADRKPLPGETVGGYIATEVMENSLSASWKSGKEESK